MKELSLKDSRLDGRYDVRRLLGRGSYAEVYLAEDTLASPESPHRFVVIKALNVFMHDDLDRDLERTLVENFQNEAVALDRVRHPNIISRLGHGTARDKYGTLFHYLVLEYLPGGDLAKFARRNELSFARSLRFIEQACSGLGHAHANGVIHRDVKPQNLLLTADHGIIKIADFGVARLSEADGPITRVGTNLYAPPEHSPVFSGTTGKLGLADLSPASDVYSLAKTAFVLFTGESPRHFANRQITELPHRTTGETWAPELLKLLRRSTDSDPGMRPQSATEFWNELSGIAAGIAEGEPALSATSLTGTAPKPSFSSGYDPVAPSRPEFESAGEVRIPAGLKEKRPGTGISVMDLPSPDGELKRNEDVQNTAPGGLTAPTSKFQAQDQSQQSRPRKRRLVKVALAAALLITFAAGLYATYNYVLSSASFSAISSMFGSREATALMNINLRSDASTSNPRIGLVPKGSRLRIMGSSGHWYEVQILTYGSPKADPGSADRGWISGKTRRGELTITIDE